MPNNPNQNQDRNREQQRTGQRDDQRSTSTPGRHGQDAPRTTPGQQEGRGNQARDTGRGKDDNR